MSVKPVRIARAAPLLVSESSPGVVSGDDVDWDTSGSGSNAIPNNLQWKQPVTCATTGAITISTGLNSGDVIDGVTLADGDRVLVKDQALPKENGIYIVDAAPFRSVDMDDPAEFPGALVWVTDGTANVGTLWYCTNTAEPVVDTDAVNFAQFTSAGAIPDLSSLTVISPAQLTANTDDWNPTGLATADVIRASTDASRNLTGILAPATTKALVLENVGAFDLVLKHDVTSTAANRFLCPNDADLTLKKDSAAWLLYDLTTARWRVIAVASAGGSGDATGQLVGGFDAGTSLLAAGDIFYLVAPYTGTITDWVILGNTTGSASFDVAEVAAGGSLPAFPGDSIVAAAPPSMTGAVQAASSTLTSWTTAITAGHLYAVKLASVSGLNWVSLTLNYSRP